MTPDLSVVVVSSWSVDAVMRSIESLVDEDIELIIISASDRDIPHAFSSRVRWIVGEPADGVPELRRLGAESATGRIVAFLEDSCIPSLGWVKAVREGFRSKDLQAATGPIEQDPHARAIDWAVFFAEYASFTASQSCRLAGPNFTCLRTILDLSKPVREHEIANRVTRIGWLPKASATHVRRYSRHEAICDRYRFGRQYGQERWEERSGRLAGLGYWACPAILGVQLARLTVSLARSPRLIAPFLGSALSSLILLMSWSLGEAAGWAAIRRDGSPRYGTMAQRLASKSDQDDSKRNGCKQRPKLA